jgi:mannose-6-phosphate isomerase-like protein (cupin superfamily)
MPRETFKRQRWLSRVACPPHRKSGVYRTSSLLARSVRFSKQRGVDSRWAGRSGFRGHSQPTSIETRAPDLKDAGAFAVIENVLTAESAGPPLHVSPSLDETFYVLEGRASFQVGEVQFTALPGASVFVARGTPHTYANPSSQRTRVLVVCRASETAAHGCRIVGEDGRALRAGEAPPAPPL